jgi:hypothetical protein
VLENAFETEKQEINALRKNHPKHQKKKEKRDDNNLNCFTFIIKSKTMEFKLADADQLLEGLYQARKAISEWKHEEEYYKKQIMQVMQAYETNQIRGANYVCTLSERSQKQISKEIPPEIVEPYYITKNYNTLNIARLH